MIEELLADVRRGSSRVLVLRGEAGMGKSALLDAIASAGSGCRVVRAAGAEWEMELPFAGLHQLCTSMLDRVERLPAPQRDAIGTAFGMVAGAPADRFLVGLAVLSLLSDAGEEQPLVCLVDDAQWLDQTSARIMAFVARRLLAEPIGLVFAVREPSNLREFDGLPDRSLGGLALEDSRRLLQAVSLGTFDPHVRDQIVAETRGNPLALIELPRGLTAAQLAGGFALPDSWPLADHLEDRFAIRIRDLPPATQRLLLAAAAEPSGDVALLRRALDRLGIGVGAEDPAEAQGLIELGARVRFRHPLVRSAVYRSADPVDRREVHRALAGATDGVADPDRRAWHRSHAADGPDESVAEELETSAERAKRRGGYAAAAAFLERATELSIDPARRSERALAAARAKFEAGAHDEVEPLLGKASLGPVSDFQAAQIDLIRAETVFARDRGSTAPPLLLAAAQALQRYDEDLARDTYLETLGAGMFAGHMNGEPSLRQIAEAARSALPADARRSTDVLLAALTARLTSGYESAVPSMQEAVQRFRDDRSSRWLWLAWLLAGEVWDDVAWEDLADAAVRTARETGALSSLPLALTYRATVHVYAGDLDAAAALVEESTNITAATGNTPPRLAALLLLAFHGDDPNAVAQVTAETANARGRGEGRGVSQGGYFHAILFNAHGRYQEALAAAQRAAEHDNLGVTSFVLVELIEAAARCRSFDVAAAALGELEARTAGIGTDWALGMLARSRALLTTNSTAEAHHHDAITRLGRTTMRVHGARAHLLFGEWLRREGRRIDARHQLRLAHDAFERMGASAFAERALRELRATGEAARRRPNGSRHPLTAQERQIAELAGQGRTNPEIGGELFISARTVEYHLKKVFVKLGIASRRELASALGALQRSTLA